MGRRRSSSPESGRSSDDGRGRRRGHGRSRRGRSESTDTSGERDRSRYERVETYLRRHILQLIYLYVSANVVIGIPAVVLLVYAM